MKQGSSFATKQGTLIALACAAAFAVPQVANAQKDGHEIVKIEGHPLTLQGNISIGYARTKTSGSAGGTAVDFPERGNVWSGESNIRFSASTKLGGEFIQGLGFQVESGYETSDGSVSGSQGTLASRNTAVGLKTSIGTIFGGKWDTPFKLTMGNFYLTASANGLGASTTGWLGTPGLAGGSFSGTINTFSGTTGTNTNAPILGNPSGTITGGGTTSVPATMNFRRRQANTINFYTPVISGFQAGLMYGPDEELGSGTPVAKPTMWSGTVGYWGGPLTVIGAYERHEDYLWGSAVGTKLTGGLNAGLGANSSDHAISLGASYAFGDVLLSGYWERLTYNQTGGAAILTGLESRKFYTAARWKISGPHSLTVAYGKAGSLSCTGTVAYMAAASCGDTGAQMYNFLYRYQLDKVSYINVFYGKLNNDKNGNFVSTSAGGSNSSSLGNGHTDSSWSVGVNTSF